MNTCFRLKLTHTCSSVLRRRYRAQAGTVIQTIPSTGPVRKEKRTEVIVNTKYDKCSDPVYAKLVYSSEVDVFLTAKRGKVWLERMYARSMAAERELKDREVAAMTPSPPIALQYLYGGSAVVQGEKDITPEETYEALTTPTLEERISSIMEEEEEMVSFPYNVHQDIHQQPTDTKPVPGPSTSSTSRGRRGRRKPQREGLKSEDYSSEDYDVIRNDLANPELREQFSEDHLFKFGTPNPSLQPSKIPCGGCGATLHSTAENIPGYIPSQLLEGKKDEELRRSLCQRCYIIKEYNIALKVSVSPEDYPKAIEHLKDKDALILLVVDLLDFPGSVWPNILDLLGKNKKIILVGNKVDLLLPDQSRYIRNITEIIREEFLKKCFNESDGSIFPKLISALCVSAKTGFNMEILIDKIFRYWRWNNNSLPGDIYILGCTNVGKSSIFNTLLESDLCKIHALDLVQKAITSPVPGTTLNLLKFPVTRPEPQFICDRTARVAQANYAISLQEQERLQNLSRFNKIEFALPTTYTITHTLKNSLKERQPQSGYLGLTEVENVTPEIPEVLDPVNQLFSSGKWCYDSPGTVSQDQIINLLTAEEINKTLPTSPLIPRTLLLRVGHTLLLGGLGRLDYIEGRDLPPVRVTVFCTNQLSINVVETEGVDEFLNNAPVTKLITVPEGGLKRMRSFPALLGKEVRLTGVSDKVGSKDIVLSSAGWVMVTPKRNEECVFIAYTPAGKGITMRSAFLPLSVNQRGRRIQGSPAYKNDRFCLDPIEI